MCGVQCGILGGVCEWCVVCVNDVWCVCVRGVCGCVAYVINSGCGLIELEFNLRCQK